MRVFRWLSAPDIPAAHDLRRCGWILRPGPPAAEEPECPLLAHYATIDAAAWLRLLGGQDQGLRRRVVLIGVGNAAERGRLLRLGFGDVTGSEVGLAEIEARCDRIAASAGTLPRRRDFGLLRLDLLARDGFANGRALGLHPREFALLWRLADTPGRTVGKAELVAEVWRMAHMPETNSIAVHVSRLRSKLALAGLDGLVQTASTGGYRLDLSPAQHARPPAVETRVLNPPE